MSGLSRLSWPGIHGVVEILFLAVAIYYVLLFFRGTRSAQVLTGLVLLLLGLIAATELFRLDTLNWLLQRFMVGLSLALVIIFQPEIRRALAELGKPHVFAVTARERSLAEAIVQSAMILSERKIGALIAVERQIGTRAIQETGKRLDAALTPELLASVFFPHTPLHDGGAVIAGERLAAAGCVFPLSQQAGLHRSIGTRHRAAVGMSEETDAVIVVVSEETGTISIALNGRLSRGFDEEKLRRILVSLLHRAKRARSRMDRLRDQLELDPERLAAEKEAAADAG